MNNHIAFVSQPLNLQVFPNSLKPGLRPTVRRRRRSSCYMTALPATFKLALTRRAFLTTLATALPLSLVAPALSEDASSTAAPQSTPAKDKPSTIPDVRPVSDIDPREAEPEITDRVYLDLSLDGRAASRVTIGLYGGVAPATVANFKALAATAYTGTSVYRVVPGLTVQLGDVLRNGGRSGRAATSDGSPLPAENFRVMHSVPGIVSMARDPNGMVDSRFFVNTRPGESGYLDGRYCAFGRVVGNMEFLYQVEKAAEKRGGFAVRLPKVTIVDSGVLP